MSSIWPNNGIIRWEDFSKIWHHDVRLLCKTLYTNDYTKQYILHQKSPFNWLNNRSIAFFFDNDDVNSVSNERWKKAPTDCGMGRRASSFRSIPSGPGVGTGAPGDCIGPRGRSCRVPPGRSRGCRAPTSWTSASVGAKSQYWSDSVGRTSSPLGQEFVIGR